MIAKQLLVTSNSNKAQIEQEFQLCNNQQQLQLSLDIHIQQEIEILSTISDQLKLLNHLEDLSITITSKCILEHIEILSNAISNLENLKKLSIIIGSHCCMQEQQFKHIAQGIQQLTQLTDFKLCVNEFNSTNENTINHLSESLKCLPHLTKLLIQIDQNNQFSSEAFQALSKGLQCLSKITDLTLYIDFTHADEYGISLLSQSLSSFNNLINFDISFDNSYDQLFGIDLIFDSLIKQQQLKKLFLRCTSTQKLQTKDILSLTKCLPNLINLEELILKDLLKRDQSQQNLLIVKSLSNLTKLKSLELNVENCDIINEEDIPIFGQVFNKFNQLQNLNLTLANNNSVQDQFVNQLSNCFCNFQLLTKLSIVIDTNNLEQSYHFFEQMRYLKNLEVLSLKLNERFKANKQGILILSQSFQQMLNLKNLQITFDYQSMQLGLENLMKSFEYLINLESLVLDFYQNLLGKELKSFADSLHNLINLKQLSFTTNSIEEINEETLINLSFSLKKLINLENLTLQFYQSPIRSKEGQKLFFESLSTLNKIQNLSLSFLIDFTNDSSQQLGDTLLEMKKLRILDLNLQKDCRLVDLYNISKGLQSEELISITMNLQELNDQNMHDNEYFIDIFGSIKNLKELFLSVSQLTSNKDYYEIIYNSLKRLQSLTKITVYLSQEAKITYQGFKSMYEFFTQSKNLLEVYFMIGELQEKINAQECFEQLYLSIQNLKNLKKLMTNLNTISLQQNLMIDSFYHLSNLRQFDLYYQPFYSYNKDIIEISENKKNENFEINSYPKYLTELNITIWQSNRLYRERFLAVFQGIRNFKYLKNFSLQITGEYKLGGKEINKLGKSLESINNLDQLTLNFGSIGKIKIQPLIQLAKGIENQIELTKFSLTILNENEIDSQGFCQLIEAIGKLKKLQQLNLVISNDCISDDSLAILGKSLSQLQYLLELSIDIQIYSGQLNFEKGLESLGNSFKYLTKLFSFQLRIIGNNIVVGKKGGVSIGKGIKHLEKLQTFRLEIGQEGQFSNEGCQELAKNLCLLTQLQNISIYIQENNDLNSDIMNEFSQSINNLSSLTNTQITLSTNGHLTKNPFEVEQLMDSEKNETCNINCNSYYYCSQCTLNYFTEQISIILTLNIKDDLNQNDVLYLTRIITHLPINYKIELQIQNLQLEEETISVLCQQIPIFKAKLIEFCFDTLPSIQSTIIDLFKGISQMQNLRDLSLNFNYNDLGFSEMIESFQNINKNKNILSLNFNLRQDANISLSQFYDIIKEICQIKSLKKLAFSVDQYMLPDYSLSTLYRIISKELPRLAYLKISN